MKRIFSIWLLFTLLNFGMKAQEINPDTLVNLKFEGVTLKQVLHDIGKQYNVRFSYSDSKIQADKIIHASYVSWNMRDMLRDLLHENKINYSIIENQIVRFPFLANHPITIRGKVIDDLTGAPIPFVHISITGTLKGTLGWS